MRAVPPYFDGLLEGFRRGRAGRHVHLGYWDGAEDDDFAAAQARLDELVLGLAGLADGQSVADVGCGFGGTLACINARHSRMRLAGVNVDPRQLDICRSIAAANGNSLHWQLGDACQLPLESSSIDRVLCVEAMFHFASRRAFLQEAARVLRPGGVLCGSDILIEPSAAGSLGALATHYGPWPDPCLAEGEHAALARSAGLQAVRWLDITRETAPTHRFTAPSSMEHDGSNSARSAALLLKRLHLDGQLRYCCFRFEKEKALEGL
jgi:MPBQ/MSBQ methyltransferase